MPNVPARTLVAAVPLRQVPWLAVAAVASTQIGKPARLSVKRTANTALVLLVVPYVLPSAE